MPTPPDTFEHYELLKNPDVALLPPLVDLMAAVNNDAGAIAAYSLFLWGAVRLIQRNTGARTAGPERSPR